jgi:multiple sugar transport system substrate-binding protein
MSVINNSFYRYFHPFLKIEYWQRSRLWRGFSLMAIAIVCSLLIIVPALSQKQITLKLLLTAPDAPPWEQIMVKEFERQHPNIHLEIVAGANSVDSIENLYTNAFLLGDSPYDLVYMDVVWTPKFASAGWLMDLTEEFNDRELAVFSPADIAGGRYKNRLYRLPVRSDAGLLYYRKDLLSAAGLSPPQNFTDIANISQMLQKKGAAKWGYLWQGRQYEGLVAMFVEVLQGFGGFWVNPETLEVGLDREETIATIEFLRQTIREGISPAGVTTYMEEDTRRLFQNGDAVFLRSWPYVWSLANREDSPIKGKIGIVPMVGTKDYKGGACLGGWGLGIAKTTKHYREALEAIRFLTREEVQKDFILTGGYIPSRQKLFNNPDVVAKYSHYPQLQEIAKNAVLRPPIAQYAQASDILQRYLSAALTEQKTPKEAMTAAANETRKLLGNRQ